MQDTEITNWNMRTNMASFHGDKRGWAFTNVKADTLPWFVLIERYRSENLTTPKNILLIFASRDHSK